MKRIIMIIITSIILIGMTGCNHNKKIAVEDYAGEEKKDEIEDADVNGMHADLYEYFGLEKGISKYEDALELTKNNENFHVEINASIQCPDLQGMSIYKMEYASFQKTEERQILESLFEKDSITEYKEAILNENLLIADLGEEALDIACFYDEQMGAYYREDVSINGWSEFSGATIHTYHGVRDNNTYEICFAYNKETEETFLTIQALSLQEMYPEYSEDENTTNYLEFMDELNVKCNTTEDMAEMENEMEEEKAKQMVENLLTNVGISYQGFEKDEVLYLTEKSEEGKLQEIKSCDGYCYNLEMRDLLYGDCFYMIPISSYGYVPALNSGEIELTSKGIVRAHFCKRVEIAEDVYNYVDMISINSIETAFRQSIADHLQCEMLEGNQIVFDKLSLCYYYVTDDRNENVFSYIPVWMLQASHASKNSTCTVILNAIDGSMIDILYMAKD